MIALSIATIGSENARQLINSYAGNEDRRYSESFRRTSRKEQSLLAGCLLRATLGHSTKTKPLHWKIERIAGKAPRASHSDVGQEVFASISHSGKYVIAGISSFGPIGVDIEVLSKPRDMEEILRATSSNRNIPIPTNKTDQYQIWTQFEAYYKTAPARANFSIPMELFNANKNEELEAPHFMLFNDQKYFFKSYIAEDYILSLCSRYQA